MKGFMMKYTFFLLAILLIGSEYATAQRPRTRDLGLEIGIFSPGPLNAITDVSGVRVGHVTIMEGDSIRTGATAVLPHSGNLFRRKVRGAVFVGNGFGKLIGSTQINELGQIETPIVLTNTLSVWDAANGIVDYMLKLPGNETVRSINPVVGETNDGFLNDIRGRHVSREDVVKAIMNALGGAVEEGSVGAGTGTICNGWKGGIGTSSRTLPDQMGGYTIGVLVQTNYGGVLDVAGVPVGKELGRYAYRQVLDRSADGSCMMIVATDAPLSVRQLQRLAARAPLALGRTGSAMSHGSGDYVIAFSTSPLPEWGPERNAVLPGISDERISPLFQGVVEATEEAILNSLFQATDVKGREGHFIDALPIDKVKELLRKYGRIR